MRTSAFLGAFFALTALAVGARAQEPPPPSTIAPADAAAIRAELARQATAIEQLRAARDDGEKPAIRVSGFVQVDWTLHNQSSQDEIDYSSGQPLNQDKLALRRGHVRVDAERGLVYGVLETDANTVNGPQVRPIDAEVGLRWPEKRDAKRPYLTASMGLLRTPFGFEVQELDEVRPFLERATVLRALFPGEFDLGARFAGGYRFAEWGVAVMNGSPIGSKEFPALAPGRTKDLLGRVGVHVEVVPDVRFEAGVSAVTGEGFHEGTPTTKDTLVWHDDNGDGIVQATEIQVIPGSSATASQQFHRFAIGADARFIVRLPTLGELTLRAEVVRATNLDRGIEVADPVGAEHDLRELGWYLGATQELTHWAMIGARYDRYDPDADATRQSAASLVPSSRAYSTLALMAMVRYETARLVFEYDKNGNALGRDATGAPTTLASDAMIVRGQVTF